MDNLLVFFDTETTGLPVWSEPSGSDEQPHIVQLAAHLVDPQDQRVIQSIDLIVRPDGWEIPQEVTEIHGITTEHALKVGVPEALVLETLLQMWNGRKRVAHNTTFDNRIIRIATKRFATERAIDQWKAGQYECTGLLSKPIMQLPPKGRFGYKMPRLEEAYQHFVGKELENAHTAIADVNACMQVYFAIKDLPQDTVT